VGKAGTLKKKGKNNAEQAEEKSWTTHSWLMGKEFGGGNGWGA